MTNVIITDGVKFVNFVHTFFQLFRNYPSASQEDQSPQT